MTRSQTESAAAETREEAPKKATRKVVKYEGQHNERVIEAAHWRQAGVEDQGKIVWGPLNDWIVDAGELSETALNYIKNVDQTDLVIKEVEVTE